jgi:hypothetical protein
MPADFTAMQSMSGGEVLQSNRCDCETLKSTLNLERFLHTEADASFDDGEETFFIPGDPQIFSESGPGHPSDPAHPST